MSRSQVQVLVTAHLLFLAILKLNFLDFSFNFFYKIKQEFWDSVERFILDKSIGAADPP